MEKAQTEALEIINNQIGELNELISVANRKGEDFGNELLERWKVRTAKILDTLFGSEEAKNFTRKAIASALTADPYFNLYEEVKMYENHLQALIDEVKKHPDTVLRQKQVPKNADAETHREEGLVELQDFYKNNVISSVGVNTWNFLSPGVQNLLTSSEILQFVFTAYSKEHDWHLNKWLLDYSFMAYPAARAFEGFLKKLAIHKKFTFKKGSTRKIVTDKYLNSNPNFPIGKIFDPDENPKINTALLDKKRFKSYPKVVSANWDLIRNRLMHYDHGKHSSTDVDTAIDLIRDVYKGIRAAYEGYIGTPNKE